MRSIRVHVGRLVLCVVYALPIAVDAVGAARGDEPWPKTIAESSGYQATAVESDVRGFLERIASRTDRIRIETFGRSVEDRPLLAAIAGDPLPASPARASDDGRLVVLLVGGIHSGECDGKEAILALLRDLAADPAHGWWRDFVLIAVPNFNVDGGERMGPGQRPGQAGPERTGRRENAQQLDLNRDFVKLETPEVRALVRFVHDWDVDVVIDTHTTNGSRHRYALTYDIPHHPAAPGAGVGFLRDHVLPVVTRRLDSQGIGTFYYGNFNADHSRWTTYGLEPRYGTEYFGLCGRFSILAESYTYRPYEERVRASWQFLSECLDAFAANRDAAVAARRTMRESVVAANQSTERDSVPIAGELAKYAEKAVIRGFRRDERGAETGTPNDYEIEFWGRAEPTRSVRRPWAYALPFEASRVAARLRMHGVRVEQLTADQTLVAESAVAEKIERRSPPFQRHALTAITARWESKDTMLPARSYVVRLNQPNANLIVNLLEPESQDGLATWNFWDADCADAGDSIPVYRISDPHDLPLREVDAIEPAERLDLDRIYGPKRRVPIGGSGGGGGRWLPGADAYLGEYGGESVRVDATTGAVSPFFDSAKVAEALGKLPEFTREQAARFARSPHALSPQADAELIELNNDLYYVKLDGSAARRLTHDPHKEQLPQFSPDGRFIAFVRQHNLHVVSIEDARGWSLTADGDASRLYGELDWVYQEEIFGRGNFRGFWWSPDSRRIALIMLDETPVHRYTVTNHMPYRQDLEVTSYPKAGDPLPHVKLGIVEAAGGAVAWVEDYEYSAAEFLIVRVAWHPSATAVYFQVQDRAQTWLDLRRADAGGGPSKRILRESSSAWIDPLDDPQWLKDGSFLWLSPRSGYVHIYRVRDDGAAVDPVTSGAWEVRSLLGADHDEQWCYFQAARETPAREQVYRVAPAGGEPQRITDGEGCHSARFNDAKTYFIDSHSRIHGPPGVRVCRADGTICHVLSAAIDDHLPYYRVNAPEPVAFAARDGHPLDAYLIKPADFDAEAAANGSKRYPVLCYVYGGPQSPVVRDRWGGSNYLWHQMLAQQGYCIWISDNRAASHRGITHTWKVHRQLGTQELADLEDGVNWLRAQPWVDADRMGIWGWSYGGYFTAYALTHSTLFKAGIAGAPVTDWRNYDAVYTERLMGMPQSNAEGYRRSSVVEGADQTHGRLLLIHGDADDNVHLANTLQLARSLQRAGKVFDMMIYPQNRHGISQPQQSRHLQELMTRFLRDHL